MDRHPEDIKADIRKAGGNLTRIAGNAGVTVQAVSATLSGRASARIEQVVAEFIGVPPNKIWPSRYQPNGQRIRLRAQSETERTAA